MPDTSGPDFWKSSGFHLLERNTEGWLGVTPQFLFAYLTRPEVHPVDESCDAERTLHAELLDDPYLAVGDERLAALADPDAADNYRVVLAFRDALAKAGTIEGTYLSLVRTGEVQHPPVFIDQLVHAIARNMLDGINDPMRVRAAEILFRSQKASTGDGRLMLADEEIVEMHARTETDVGLAQLLAENGNADAQRRIGRARR